MAIDNKYGMITFVDADENSIAVDEPVFIFRAKDRLVSRVLSYYAYLCERAESDPEHIKSIDSAREAIEYWQQLHGSEIPGK